MLSRNALPVDIGEKYFDGNSYLLQKAPQVFGRKTYHIPQFEKVYGMRTVITIVKADYCLMSQLLLNILSNITLPPYPSFFIHFKHIFVTHPTKISRFSITVTPPPRDTACHPPPKILNVHYNGKNWQLRTLWGSFVALKFYMFFKKKIIQSCIEAKVKNEDEFSDQRLRM